MTIAIALGLIALAVLGLLAAALGIIWYLTPAPEATDSEMQDYLDFLHEMRAE